MGFQYIDHFNVNEKTDYKQAGSLDELSYNIRNCHLCDLSKSRRQSMCGFGNANAKLVIIDYLVSQTQDNTNGYYAGRSGEILKNMIENVLHLKIDDVYITHAIKCKPLQSNKPSKSEWNLCKEYLFSQLALIQPKIIVTLGEEAYAHVTNDKAENFENIRGHLIDFKDSKLVPIYHPQYLLRNPELKIITLNDLQTIKNCL